MKQPIYYTVLTKYDNFETMLQKIKKHILPVPAVPLYE